MRVIRGLEQQGRGVDRATRYDDQSRAHAPHLAVDLDVNRLGLATPSVGDEPSRARVGPQGHVRPLDGGAHGADVRLALCVHLARKRVARVAEDASPGVAGTQQSQRQRRGVQSLLPQPGDDLGHPVGVGHRGMGKRAMRRLGRIVPQVAADLIETFRAIVVRRQLLVVNRPGWRHAIHVLEFAEILASQPVEHAAPELRVAPDAVVGVRPELRAAFVHPPFARLVPQMPPDRLRVPVLVLLRNEVAALDDEDPGGESESACAMVPPPAPLPMMMMS